MKAHQQMPTEIKKAKIACLDFNLNKFRESSFVCGLQMAQLLSTGAQNLFSFVLKAGDPHVAGRINQVDAQDQTPVEPGEVLLALFAMVQPVVKVYHLAKTFLQSDVI